VFLFPLGQHRRGGVVVHPLLALVPRRGAFGQSAVVDQAHAPEGARQLRCLRICGVEAVLERPLHRAPGHASQPSRFFVSSWREGERRFLPALKDGVSTPNKLMSTLSSSLSALSSSTMADLYEKFSRRLDLGWGGASSTPPR